MTILDLVPGDLYYYDGYRHVNGEIRILIYRNETRCGYLATSRNGVLFRFYEYNLSYGNIRTKYVKFNLCLLRGIITVSAPLHKCKQVICIIQNSHAMINLYTYSCFWAVIRSDFTR